MSKKQVLSKFTILCLAAFIAILGCMLSAGRGLDTPAVKIKQLSIICHAGSCYCVPPCFSLLISIVPKTP